MGVKTVKWIVGEMPSCPDCGVSLTSYEFFGISASSDDDAMNWECPKCGANYDLIEV